MELDKCFLFSFSRSRKQMHQRSASTCQTIVSLCPVLWNGTLQVLRSLAAGPAALEIETPLPHPASLTTTSVEDVIFVAEFQNPTRGVSVIPIRFVIISLSLVRSDVDTHCAIQNSVTEFSE